MLRRGKTPAKRIFHSERGQSLTEFALVLPLLLLLLLGTIEFGRILGTYLMMANLSREGARAAAVGESDAVIEEKIYSAAPLLDPERLYIDISPSPPRERGSAVTVKLDYSVPLIAPLPSVIISNPFPLHTETTMRVE